MAGWEFLPRLSNQKAEYRLRVDSAAGYSMQLVLALALLADSRSAGLQHALVLVIVALYCSALGRAWEVTGITRRG